MFAVAVVPFCATPAVGDASPSLCSASRRTGVLWTIRICVAMSSGVSSSGVVPE